MKPTRALNLNFGLATVALAWLISPSPSRAQTVAYDDAAYTSFDSAPCGIEVQRVRRDSAISKERVRDRKSIDKLGCYRVPFPDGFFGATRRDQHAEDRTTGSLEPAGSGISTECAWRFHGFTSSHKHDSRGIWWCERTFS